MASSSASQQRPRCVWELNYFSQKIKPNDRKHHLLTLRFHTYFCYKWSQTSFWHYLDNNVFFHLSRQALPPQQALSTRSPGQRGVGVIHTQWSRKKGVCEELIVDSLDKANQQQQYQQEEDAGQADRHRMVSVRRGWQCSFWETSSAWWRKTAQQK